MKATPSVPARPAPPDALIEGPAEFLPAPEVAAWINAHLIDEAGELYNEEHRHLAFADFDVLWAANGYSSKGRKVVGQAEELVFRCGKWARGRQEQQMREWFGRVPDFLITLDADYCRNCDDVSWCALVEHELYHIGQQMNDYGAPEFTKDGRPKLMIRGHDVEEFVGVVERYGVGPSEGRLASLVRAANRGPQVGRLQISNACGTCMRLVV